MARGLSWTYAASPPRRAEYSLDAVPWTPIEAADGLIDCSGKNCWFNAGLVSSDI